VIEQRVVASDGLTEDERVQMRRMFAAAWDRGFSQEDWDHTFGGLHVLRSVDDQLVAHGSVAERTLWLDGAEFRAGYLEAVATRPAYQGRGHGSAVVRELDRIVRGDFELGGLSTGRPSFYERLGWRRWRGPLAVRTAEGDVPTPEEAGAIFVLPTPALPDPDLDATLVCDWRTGDVW
jgi:aminoglycoside 2'-N-acetyltransferase I